MRTKLSSQSISSLWFSILQFFHQKYFIMAGLRESLLGRAYSVCWILPQCFIYLWPLFLYLYSIWLWVHPAVFEGNSKTLAGAKLRSKAQSSWNDSSWTDWFILKLPFVFKDTPFRNNTPPVCYLWQDQGHRLSVSALGREMSSCICLKTDIKTQGCCGNEVIIMLNFN